MARQVLVDTGPLVALLDGSDAWHSVCVETSKELPVPLLTCWPVIAEAAWLLRQSPQAMDALLARCEDGTLDVCHLEAEDVKRIRRMLLKYADIGAHLADAALVRLAEREKLDTIFTLDQHDFRIYRLEGNRSLRIIP